MYNIQMCGSKTDSSQTSQKGFKYFIYLFDSPMLLLCENEFV